MYPTLTPAYGRDYKSKKAILEDLRAGKDFILVLVHGGLINLEQMEKGQKYNVRYQKLTKTCVVYVDHDGSVR